MIGKALLTYADKGGETSPVSINCAVLTASNFDAQNTKFNEFQTALEALTLGLNVKKEIKNSEGTGEGEATDYNAGRELKWLVYYRDNDNNKKYRLEIPCPLRSANTMTPGKEKKANLSDALWTAFKDKFEAFVLSPEGHAVTLVDAKIVGRNN